MNAFVNAVRQIPDSQTEKGAATFSSSLNSNVDLFFKIGAARSDIKGLIKLFSEAYAEDPYLATRIALWARDVRGGAGEREAFRQILKWFEKNNESVFGQLIPLVAEYGRWDDLLQVETALGQVLVAKEVKKALESGTKAIHILGKLESLSETECEVILKSLA